jgi:hypothetical protein
MEMCLSKTDSSSLMPRTQFSLNSSRIIFAQLPSTRRSSWHQPRLHSDDKKCCCCCLPYLRRQVLNASVSLFCLANPCFENKSRPTPHPHFIGFFPSIPRSTSRRIHKLYPLIHSALVSSVRITIVSASAIFCERKYEVFCRKNATAFVLIFPLLLVLTSPSSLPLTLTEALAIAFCNSLF